MRARAGASDTETMTEFPGLTNQLLIAMPALGDPNFQRTVTLVCEHNPDGALGIIINRPLDVRLGEILAQLDLEEAGEEIAGHEVLLGGPVQQERGFVVHRPAGKWDSTVQISDDIGLTTSRDILSAMARGDGPKKSLVALGYAGWTAGQLEHEMQANAWLSVPANAEIIFDTPFHARWHNAARLLGIDIEQLGVEAGHA